MDTFCRLRAIGLDLYIVASCTGVCLTLCLLQADNSRHKYPTSEDFHMNYENVQNNHVARLLNNEAPSASITS